MIRISHAYRVKTSNLIGVVNPVTHLYHHLQGFLSPFVTISWGPILYQSWLRSKGEISCLVWGLVARPTVDGSEIPFPTTGWMYINLCKWWEKLPTSTGEFTGCLSSICIYDPTLRISDWTLENGGVNEAAYSRVCFFGLQDNEAIWSNTVDGRNPAPPGMYKTL